MSDRSTTASALLVPAVINSLFTSSANSIFATVLFYEVLTFNFSVCRHRLRKRKAKYVREGRNCLVFPKVFRQTGVCNLPKLAVRIWSSYYPSISLQQFDTQLFISNQFSRERRVEGNEPGKESELFRPNRDANERRSALILRSRRLSNYDNNAVLHNSIVLRVSATISLAHSKLLYRRQGVYTWMLCKFRRRIRGANGRARSQR